MLEDPFPDLLEEAPSIALLLDAQHRVAAANRAAREFFAIDPARLPAGLLEITREGRLHQALEAGREDLEIRLAHRRRIVKARLAPGPRARDVLLFLDDVTELRRLEKVRQEFVANLSHELRTPLTSLRLAAESLLGDPPPPARRTFAERALREADHLSAIIDNLRQLAELETAPPLLRPGRFELSELIAETAARQHLHQRVKASGTELWVLADRARLAQALGNLLDNAAKFSPPASPIEVGAEVRAGELLITVRDHGPGISPEHWSRVFERFYKVDPSRSREVPGTGLGLAIAKHMVLAQGGRVWTEAGPGGGQVFGLALPQPIHNAEITSP